MSGRRRHVTPLYQFGSWIGGGLFALAGLRHLISSARHGVLAQGTGAAATLSTETATGVGLVGAGAAAIMAPIVKEVVAGFWADRKDARAAKVQYLQEQIDAVREDAAHDIALAKAEAKAEADRKAEALAVENAALAARVRELEAQVPVNATRLVRAEGNVAALKGQHEAVVGVLRASGWVAAGSSDEIVAEATAPPRVLIVEDDPKAVEALNRLFTAAGFQCDTALESGDAVALLARCPDWVLLDLVLADGETGLDVFRAIRARCPGCKVAVVTGAPEGSERLAAARALGPEIEERKPMVDSGTLDRLIVRMRHWGEG